MAWEIATGLLAVAVPLCSWFFYWSGRAYQLSLQIKELEARNKE